MFNIRFSIRPSTFIKKKQNKIIRFCTVYLNDYIFRLIFFSKLSGVFFLKSQPFEIVSSLLERLHRYSYNIYVFYD